MFDVLELSTRNRFWSIYDLTNESKRRLANWPLVVFQMLKEFSSPRSHSRKIHFTVREISLSKTLSNDLLGEKYDTVYNIACGL